jgi:hypothetical protein
MTEPLQVAETVFAQMGGKGRLSAMVGAHNFSYDARDERRTVATFHFKGCRKANVCRVAYDYASDTYGFYLVRYSPKKLTLTPVVAIDRDVYAEDLRRLFESNTGLYLTF